MPYMFPRLTDRPHTKISSKTYRQSIPYIYPEAGRERKNEICGAKKSKSFKKSTLRAKKKTIVTGENLDSATGPIKKLDPAKITHSIPDFVSRNQIHTPDIWQDLESTLPISKIKTCRVLNPYFGTSLTRTPGLELVGHGYTKIPVTCTCRCLLHVHVDDLVAITRETR